MGSAVTRPLGLETMRTFETLRRVIQYNTQRKRLLSTRQAQALVQRRDPGCRQGNRRLLEPSPAPAACRSLQGRVFQRSSGTPAASDASSFRQGRRSIPSTRGRTLARGSSAAAFHLLAGSPLRLSPNTSPSDFAHTVMGLKELLLLGKELRGPPRGFCVETSARCRTRRAGEGRMNISTP